MSTGVTLAVIEGLAKSIGQIKASVDQAIADFRTGIARADRERNLLAIGLESRDEAIAALKARSDMRESLVKELIDRCVRLEQIEARLDTSEKSPGKIEARSGESDRLLRLIAEVTELEALRPELTAMADRLHRAEGELVEAKRAVLDLDAQHAILDSRIVELEAQNLVTQGKLNEAIGQATSYREALATVEARFDHFESATVGRIEQLESPEESSVEPRAKKGRGG